MVMLEEGTGLTGATGPSYATRSAVGRHHPSLNPSSVSESDAVAEFNAAAAGPQLKLGAKIPLSERLAVEVQREAREEAEEEELQQRKRQKKQESQQQGEDAQQSQTQSTEQGESSEEAKVAAIGKTKAAGAKERDSTPASSGRKASATPAIGATSTAAAATTRDEYGLLQPTYADLPPQPPVFRTVDIQREVARMRDARKALRFDLSLRGAGPSASVATAVSSSSSSSSSAGANGSGGASVAGGSSGAGANGNAGSSSSPAPAFLSGVRDATFNGLGAEGAKAAQTAALPSICAYTFHDADDGLTSCRFSPDLSLVAAGFEESFVQVWSTKGESLRGLRSDFKLSEVRDAKSLRSKRDASNMSTRKLIGHSGPVYAIDFDPMAGTSAPSRNLLSASADGTARLWSMDTFTALVAYRGHQQPVWDVQWSPLGVYFATASADKTARLWSTERINPLRMYSGHHSDVDTLAFHPNSLYLATGSSDRTARLWDVQRGACVRLFVGHNDAVSALSMSKDGRYLATADGASGAGGAQGGEISLWDLGSGRRIKKMWGHDSIITSMDFSQDGSLLVSTAMDYTVRTWDVNAPQSSPNSASAAVTATSSKEASSTGLTGASSSSSSSSSADLVATFYTKRTNMLDVTFTPRNLCLCAGPYDANL